jgi:hypothetical protein
MTNEITDMTMETASEVGDAVMDTFHTTGGIAMNTAHGAINTAQGVGNIAMDTVQGVGNVAINTAQDVKPILLKNVKVELNEDDEFGDAFIDDDDNYGSFSDSYDEFPDPPNNVKLISNHETTFTTAEGTNFDETDFTISVGRGEVKIFFCV